MKAAIAVLFLSIVSLVHGEDPTEHHCSMMKHEESASKHDEMVKHGEMAMGFSQSKTTHHFHLSPSGGSIEVQTNDPLDTGSRDHIRHHLRGIATAFAAGDFSSPMLTHGKVPTGVPGLERLKGNLTYTYIETDRGGKVVIRAATAEALTAVQEFLRFQIQEHETGDSVTVNNGESLPARRD